MNQSFKSFLKAARASQPLNAWTTSTIRFALGAVGWLPPTVVKHVIRMGEVRCTLPNGSTARFWSRGDDGIANELFWRGWTGSEPETAPLFFTLAQKSRATLDIGAFVGYYAVLAGLANPSGTVYAFEPLPAIRARLENNLQLNGLANAHVVPKAVSSAIGTAQFFHTDQSKLPTSSSLSSEFMNAAVKTGLMRESVEVTTVDEVVRERKIAAVDLVKIDTETTEPEVLRGMSETLRRDRPDIICEVLEFGGSAQQLGPMLAPLGYRFYHLRDTGPVATDSIVAHRKFLNYFFTARGSLPSS